MHFHKTKTGQPRTIPIHEHLIEMGFIDFVKSRKSGPLFVCTWCAPSCESEVCA
jgi:hypothetical protein